MGGTGCTEHAQVIKETCRLHLHNLTRLFRIDKHFIARSVAIRSQLFLLAGPHNSRNHSYVQEDLGCGTELLGKCVQPTLNITTPKLPQRK